MGAGAGALAVAAEETQLRTAAVVVFADVGACIECEKLMGFVLSHKFSVVLQSPTVKRSILRLWYKHFSSLVPTLLSGPVENLDILQLHSNASPELHGISGIVFASSLDGAVGMGSKKRRQ